MKVYLINLDKDRERLLAADAQLKRLGVLYERVSATYAKELSKKILSSAINRFRWWCAIGRPVMIGEIGCAMSHYGIYRKIVEPICVLEDDVILDSKFLEVLQMVENWIDPQKPQVVLLSNHTKECGMGIVRTRSDMYTEGYVLTPVAAKALLKANWPMQTPCDHWGRWVRLGLIQLYHAYPTVCSQNQNQYMSGTVDDGCFDVKRLGLVGYLFHKAKRIIGKVVDLCLLVVEKKYV